MNISAVVKDLSISQNSFYMIKEFNKLLDNPDVSTGAFYQRASIPATTACFGTKICAHISSYNGVLIASSLELLEMCLKFHINSDIYFYVWDLDWLDNPVYFSTAMEIMRNDQVKILARSESHAECINNFCNKEVIGIVDNWNSTQLLKIIKTTQQS